MSEAISVTSGIRGTNPGVKAGRNWHSVGAEAKFEQILEQAKRQVEPPKFSAHALSRLEQRHIQLTPNQVSEIGWAMARAREKGARQSLLVYGDLAMVASISNNTIVTALNGSEMKERVFTNIDSAVIV